MTAHDLTAAQWYPLWKLKRDGPGTAQELARDMDIDAGAMTRLIDRLAAKGLVERLRSATDRRVVTLTLTPAGEAVAAHIPQVLAEVNNSYLRGFSRDEWQLLKQLLRRMLDSGPPRRHGGGGS
jgi:DNA-binding MarR family transcriptional regulator